MINDMEEFNYPATRVDVNDGLIECIWVEDKYAGKREYNPVGFDEDDTLDIYSKAIIVFENGKRMLIETSENVWLKYLP